MPRLFLDLDGVLADFDAGLLKLYPEHCFNRSESGKLYWRDSEPEDMWQRIDEQGWFFLDLAPCPDMRTLLDHARKYEPTILTGVPNTHREKVARQKLAWCAHYAEGVPVIVTESKLKAKHCKLGDVLVDDWERYKLLWEAAGGRWVTHTSAEESVRQLQALGFV